MSNMPYDADTPGRLLATARVRAGLTLGDVAARSKVPVAALEAIDADDYRRIGAPVYARGFVRLYAREVGLDPAVPIGLLDAALADARVTAPTEPRAPEAPARRGSGRRTRAMYSLAAVALIAAVLLVLLSATSGPTTERDLRPETAAPVVVPMPMEVMGERVGERMGERGSERVGEAPAEPGDRALPTPTALPATDADDAPEPAPAATERPARRLPAFEPPAE
jgi:cytoskeleton protein RodZ